MNAGVRRSALAGAVLVLLVGASAPAAAAATQVGFAGHSFSAYSPESVGGSVTGQKPESKLWYLDGKWWASMVSTALSGAHTIHRLDGTTWVDTRVVTDSRPTIKEDVLLVGTKLYVAARASGSAGSNRLRRYTYAGGAYTLDSGFPVDIPGAGAETLTLARDTLGKLWIAFALSNRVYVARSQASDTAWGSAFVLPGATGLHSDDIATIISFTDAAGPAVGVMWSNQNDDKQHFAVHRDGASDTTWTRETALAGSGQVDDHINLKTYGGRVFAVVKTGLEDAGASSDADQIKLLVRGTSGSWASHSVAAISEDHTRPITVLEIDPAGRQVYVFMTSGVGDSANGIAYKQTSLDMISFPSRTTTFIQGANGENIDDPTSAKQNLSAATGIVVLASDGTRYWWNRIGPAGAPANSAPSAHAGSATTPKGTAVQVTLRGTDAESCELAFTIAAQPAHGTLGALTGAACAPGSPNADSAAVTYTPAAGYVGSDSFSFRVSDGALTATATVTITVSDPGAPAGIVFHGASSAGNAATSSLTLDRPAGMLSGDLLLAAVAVRGSPAITAPAGWTLVRSDQSGYTIKQSLYVKVASGSEPAAYTWTFASAQGAAGGILAYGGVDAANPVDAHGGRANAASTQISAPSITTTSANARLVGVFGTSAQAAASPPAGMSERYDRSSTAGSYRASVEAADQSLGAAGSTGTRTAVSALTAVNIGQLVALRPA
ncbi:MAG: Ig-like domain-containing protein [Gaiellaceae bacterium]